jgi:lipoprotein-releasing system ATP-binding protein
MSEGAGVGGGAGVRAGAGLATAVLPLEARGLEKRYVGGDGSTIDILKGVTLELARGEAVAITGASGAGKSTLLHLLGVLDRPTAGEVLVGGREVSLLGEEELADVRNRHVGFVFQFHHLLREFTALENVMMPALLAGVGMGEARRRAGALLGEVGLAARETHKPRQLSGGEQQRVAVARALVNEPLVLLATSPRATSIRTRASGSTTCSSASGPGASSRSSWSPTMQIWPGGPTGSCASRTDGS